MIYLATPYAHPDPAVMQARYQTVNRIACELMLAGELVYSPITHNHPLALTGTLPRGWDFWEKFDIPMLRLCDKIVVVQLPGWEASVGVTAEIAYAQANDIAVEYLVAALCEPEDKSNVANLPCSSPPPNDEWIDRLTATSLPHVRRDFIGEVKEMSRTELQRRVLIGSDWVGSFHGCLDGLKEIAVIPGGGIDGCRDPHDIRRIVETLLAACPLTWEDCWKGRPKGQAPPLPEVLTDKPRRLWIQFRAGGERGIQNVWEFSPWPDEANDKLGLAVEYVRADTVAATIVAPREGTEEDAFVFEWSKVGKDHPRCGSHNATVERKRCLLPEDHAGPHLFE